MIRFFCDGAPQDIIVDDWLPVQEDGTPAFTKGGEDGLEIWPAIIEKAYAKLYGSYAAIESGKVHLALADMVVNGFPEQIELKGININVLANKLRTLDAVQVLMGVGTPEHERGDQ